MTRCGELFDRVGRGLVDQHPGDEAARMLRSPGLRTSGRFYGFCPGADIVVKLPTERVRDLVATGEGCPCEPRPGRVARQWVRLQPSDDAAMTAYLLEARAFVAAQGTTS